MEDNKVKMVVIVVALENQEENVKKVLKEAVELSRKEKTNYEYDLHQDCKDPKIFVFTETWENEEAIKAHQQTEHFKKLEAEIPKLCDMSQAKFYQMKKI